MFLGAVFKCNFHIASCYKNNLLYIKMICIMLLSITDRHDFLWSGYKFYMNDKCFDYETFFQKKY